MSMDARISLEDEAQFVLKKNFLGTAGVLYSLASTVLFSVGSLLVKLSSDIPPFEILFYRSILQLVLLLPSMFYYKDSFIGDLRSVHFLIAKSFMGNVALVSYFYAFQTMPLADSTVLIFTSPVFTAALARLILKETWTVFDGIASVMSVIGVILILRPTFVSQNESLGTHFDNPISSCSVALFGAIMASFSFIAGRKVGETTSHRTTEFYFTICGYCLGFLGAVSSEHRFRGITCGSYQNYYILGVGVCGFLGNLTLSKSFMLEKSATVTMLRTIDMPLAFILQSIFLHAPWNTYSFFAAVLITFCNMCVFLKKWHNVNVVAQEEPTRVKNGIEYIPLYKMKKMRKM